MAVKERENTHYTEAHQNRCAIADAKLLRDFSNSASAGLRGPLCAVACVAPGDS